MKIVHCIWAFPTGGSETMLVDIVNQQSKNGDQVTLIIINNIVDQALVETISPQVKVICLKRAPSSKNPWPFVKFNQLLFRLRPQVVHMHSGTLASITLYKPTNGIFLTVHSKNFQISSAPKHKGIIAISHAVADDIRKLYDLDSTVIFNGIDTSIIETREKKPIDGKLKIVQIGRLEALRKGQDILLRSLYELKLRGFKEATIDFIGNGDDMPMLQSMARELGLDEQVTFLGARNRKYIYSHLKDYDLMVHPSRSEGFGLTIAEAMAAKVPVAVSNDGGPYEIVEHGSLGYVFEQDNVLSCANAIKDIYDNYQEALKKIENARTTVVAKYGLKSMVDSYKQMYQNT